MSKIKLLSSLVEIKPYAWDIDNDSSYLYHGIFNFILNKKIIISLIPYWKNNENVSKITAPDNFDKISSTDQAKDIALLLSTFTITFNESLSNKSFAIKNSEMNNDKEVTIFFVSEGDFKLFQKDINYLASNVVYNHPNGLKLKDISEYHISNFIIENLGNINCEKLNIDNK